MNYQISLRWIMWLLPLVLTFLVNGCAQQRPVPTTLPVAKPTTVLPTICWGETPRPLPRWRPGADPNATWHIVVGPFIVNPDNTTTPTVYEYGRGNYIQTGVMFAGRVQGASEDTQVELRYKGVCGREHTHRTWSHKLRISGGWTEDRYYLLSTAEPFISAILQVVRKEPPQ